MHELAKRLIKNHEGYVSGVYVCPAGKLTFGYGRNVEEVGLSRDEVIYTLQNLTSPKLIANRLLENDITHCIEDLKTFEFWEQLDPIRRAAVTDLRYNIGPSRFRQFKKFMAALIEQKWIAASEELHDSRWYGQVGHRAKNLMHIIRTGELPEALK